MRNDQDKKHVIGGIYAVESLDQNETMLSVLVDVDCDDVTLFPISTEIVFAADWDVFLEPCALDNAAFAEVWNMVFVPPEQLRELICVVLDPDLFAEAYDRMFSGEPLATDRWKQGPPIMRRDDVRLDFRDRERDRAALFRPAWEDGYESSG